MSDVVFVTIVVTGFTVAFLHAAIPTHWLPFVVAARAQNWNRTKTLAITGIAGTGHVLFTIALGVLIVWGGMAINTKVGNAFPLIAGGALIALGLFYLIRQVRGSHGHVHLLGEHGHHEHKHDHEPEQDWSRHRSDWAAIAGLFALLTFSPCEAFLPVFLTGAKYGWFGFLLLSAVLAVATVAGMVTFTWLTLVGIQRLRFKGLEKYEQLIVGAVFCLLGLLIIFFER
jgi:nickel/cobalt exporter